jgi:AcrR family transcriptional regulator
MNAPGAEDGRTKRAAGRRESRRMAILRGARDVFGRNGYHNTHVSDILEASGIARGTFYLYFDSKSAIFLELLDELLAELRSAIVGVDTQPDSPPIHMQLQGTVRQILGTVVENRALATILLREAVGLDVEADTRLRAFYGALLAYIKDALIEGQRIGIVRSLDTELAAMCILGTIKQFIEQFVMMPSDAPIDVDRTALEVLDFNLRGVLAT